ncbi:ty3-gypsy retroelement transposase [Cucumis melo var. makuwa]|uniref:Ty3-gypsy retroelement transposase n=1 Tax=Cucumis melo var. makuwa TaxID=1194695 RepID=A0A5A7SU57_CUCMM|nr:ty3-gypsy retroelement transposase [Cucumis melo var. makuwa]TYK03475.1 ty3-gypsy retroelement transposase [Cucumis melo var. makuwa]
MRTITLRSSNSGEVRKERSMKRLPDVEFQARKEKGLCFKCNEKYSAYHKWTMKVRGKLQNEEVVILIDCGDTHNFVSEKLVKQLQLPIKETPHYGEKFLPLELGGVDIILRMQWLYLLGVTVVDWNNLSLTFSCHDKQICIKGDPSLTKSRVSLKNIIKSWGDHDEGYLTECRAVEVGGLIKAEFCEADENPTTTDSVLILLDKHTNVFEWPKRLPPRRSIEHHIHLKKGTDPINVRPYRVVNNATIPDKFPIPVVEELLVELSGASLFSKIDLKVGYHQIRMADEDIEKTAFRTQEDSL